MDTTTLIGFIGAVILLVAFVGVEFKKIKSGTLLFGVLNVVGAGLLAWYAMLLDSLPFLIIESIWALVGLRDVIRALAGRGEKR